MKDLSKKKSITPKKKKVVTKKKVAIKKKVVKKLQKKTVPANTIKATRKKVAPTVPRTISIKRENIKKETVVVLPEKMNQEAISRSKELRLQLDKYIHESVYRVANVSAFCFLFVGAAFAFFGMSDSSLQTTFLKAEVISSVTSVDQAMSSEIKEPTFNFLTAFPDTVSKPLAVNFVATDFDEIRLELHQIGGKSIALTYDQIINEKYSTNVPDTVKPGFYELRAYVQSKQNSAPSIYSSNQFFIGTEELKGEPSSPAVTSEDIVDIELVNNDKTIVDKKSETKSVVDTTIDSISEKQIEQTTSVDNIIEARTPVGVAEGSDEEFAIEDFRLIANTKTISGVANMTVTVPVEIAVSELYYRPLNSLEYRFLVRDSQRNGIRSFIFDSTNIPDGQYKFVAKATVNGLKKQTNPVDIIVSNNQSFSITAVAPAVSEESTVEKREFLEIGNGLSDSSMTLEGEVTEVVQELLLENKASINELLKRYASALQSGDPMLIAAAAEQLKKERESIVLNALQDENTRFFADDIDAKLQARIDGLIQRTSTFEQLRTEKSSGASRIDTDSDGISDFDEKFQYKTDPDKADTDNDGISDGVEIIQGFNPTDASMEAVIVFESPKDSVGLERSDVLEVIAVPIISTGSTSEVEQNRTEIRGKALPDSFVTLYIFSSPTIVTIKTDADGSFVYTFEKELEDGRHDIFVAVTDNTGSIIAQSNPFSFIKEAQAFTPVDAQERTIVTGETIAEAGNSDYVTVVGIAILALGIILLMLGIGLRQRNDSDSSKEDTDEDLVTFSDQDESETADIKYKN